MNSYRRLLRYAVPYWPTLLMAGGLALLIVAAPLAYFSYKKSLALVREGKA